MGGHLAALLQKEEYEVVIIDQDKNRLAKIRDSLDVQTLLGNGTDPKALKRAGVEDADLVIALTNVDEANLLAAFTAKQLGVAKCVARARSPWCLDTRDVNLRVELGIDLILNPEQLIALEIVRYLDNPDALVLARFAYGKVQLRTLVMDSDSKFAGQRLMDCRLPPGVLVAVRSRGKEVIIPNGESDLQPGDKLTIMGVAEKLPEAQKLFHTAVERARHVTIAGGGLTGLFLAETLEKRSFEVRVIEKSRDRCEEISEHLDRAQVIHGDSTDKGFLKEERIATSDVFVAVTGDDEDNLMSCLLAKELGVEQTVVTLSRPDYASLIEKFGINIALSPRRVMAERILTLISHGRLQAVTLLEEGQVEVIEMIAGHGSPTVGKPLSQLTLPKNALISTIIHLGQTIVPGGQDTVQPGDTVIAVGFPEAIDEIEEGFRGR